MDKTEFEVQLKKDLPKIKNYLLKKTSDIDLSEEILQETLASASQSYEFFEEKSSFFTWICSIANHELVDYFRKKKIKTLLFSRFPFLEEILTEALGKDEEIEKQELGKEVKKVLSNLSEGYGEILRLKYYQQLSMGAIAVKLKTTIKAVESRLSRARLAFRKNWAKV